MAGKELLRVYCIGSGSCNLTSIWPQIDKAISHAFESAKFNGKPPVAVLANEKTLLSSFGAKEENVIRAINEMQKDLPQEIWVAVAFNLFQKNDKAEYASTGHLFTRNEHKKEPQRAYTPFVNDLLNENTPNPAHQIDAYESRQNENEGKPFPMLQMPDGTWLEHRICVDVTFPPSDPNKNMITLVSADGLTKSSISGFSPLRKKVVVNDYVHPIKVSLGRMRSTYSISYLGKGMAVVSLYEDEEPG